MYLHAKWLKDCVIGPMPSSNVEAAYVAALRRVHAVAAVSLRHLDAKELQFSATLTQAQCVFGHQGSPC
jgi:hypothetical protein